MENEYEKKASQIVLDVFNGFSAEGFINAVEAYVNPCFSLENMTRKFMDMDSGKQDLLQKAIMSCVHAMSGSAWIDGRNEDAAYACNILDTKDDPMPDVGREFVRMHPTLQQDAMRLFCLYIDKSECGGYEEGLGKLRAEFGGNWYNFRYI